MRITQVHVQDSVHVLNFVYVHTFVFVCLYIENSFHMWKWVLKHFCADLYKAMLNLMWCTVCVHKYVHVFEYYNAQVLYCVCSTDWRDSNSHIGFNTKGNKTLSLVSVSPQFRLLMVGLKSI